MSLLPRFLLGFEDPVLSSLTESGQSGVPIVLMMFLYEARARLVQEGTPFGIDWDQEGSKTQGKPSKMTLYMVLCAG